MHKNIIFVSGASLAIAIFIVPLVTKLALRFNYLDHPSHRSSHIYPTPRVGGIGILVGALVGAVIIMESNESYRDWHNLILMALLVSASLLGFADDIFQLPIAGRMPLYLLITSLIALLVTHVETISLPGFPSVSIGAIGGFLFSVIFIAWYTNLFNFMDGINGIAGLTGIVTLSALSVAIFFSHGSGAMGLLAVAIAAATAGFVLYNFPAALVFMGDSGSIFLGMAIGSLSLELIELNILSMAATIFLMLPFVFDATFTLFRRVISRERFWMAHRSHIYQQMCDLGISSQNVTIFYGLASIFFAFTGLLFDHLPDNLQITIWWLSLSLMLAFSIFIVNKHKNYRLSIKIDSDGAIPEKNQLNYR